MQVVDGAELLAGEHVGQPSRPPGRCSERTLPVIASPEKFSAVICSVVVGAAGGPSPARPCCETSGTSIWVAVAIPYAVADVDDPAQAVRRTSPGRRAAPAASRRGCGRRGIRPSRGGLVDAAQVVRAAVEPARVAVGDQVGDLGRVDGQHPRQVPPGEREDARLQRVEHRQQQVDLLDLVALGSA